jgi:hypothetical protein
MTGKGNCKKQPVVGRFQREAGNDNNFLFGFMGVWAL